jgi:hypothetical protein
VHEVKATCCVDNRVGWRRLSLVAEVGYFRGRLKKLLFWNLLFSVFPLFFRFEQSQQTASDACCRDTWCSLEDFEFSNFVQLLADVDTFGIDARVITMEVELTVELIKDLLTDSVRSVGVTFIDPLACAHQLHPFFPVHHRWAFVYQYFRVRVQTENQNVGQDTSLPYSVVMASVAQVETTVEVAPWFPLLLAELMELQLLWLMCQLLQQQVRVTCFVTRLIVILRIKSLPVHCGHFVQSRVNIITIVGFLTMVITKFAYRNHLEKKRCKLYVFLC